jgi:ribonuclease D
MKAWMRTTGDLAAGCAELRRGGVAALDTEFVWMRTYRAEMGIVQLAAADGEGGAFDCRAGADSSALAELLEDAGTVKVLHDAAQDLWHLRHYCGGRARNVFDTRLAAGFCGLGGGLSLAKLVLALTGVELPKSETRTDWTRRPLSEAQLAYAMDDVKYLGRMRETLLARAEERGTARWMAEEMAERGKDAMEDVVPEEAWRRVRGIGRLGRRELAALRELAAARERTAMEWNLPRAWLGEDGSLAEMARSAGRGREGIPRFRHRLKGRERVREMGERYEDALAAAARLPAAEWPEVPAQRKKSPACLEEAMAWLERRGAETGVDPMVVTSKAGLADYLNGEEGNRLGTGWRWEAAGRELRERFG